MLGATGEPQIGERLIVDREDAAGRAVFGRHVGDGAAIGHRKRGHALAVELDELPDHALLAKHLGDGEHQIGGGRALGHLAEEPEADDLRDEHAHRLTEHRRLGLDAADAPTEDAEAVDHRGVRIGSDEGVGIGNLFALDRAGEDHARQVLDVHLMHDAGAGRNGREVLERLLAPAKKLIALLVASELDVRVLEQRLFGAVHVDLHRVIDHELDGRERIDLPGLAAHGAHRVAHRGEVDHAWDTGEVLEQRARGRVGDLARGLCLCVPRRERGDVVGTHREPILVAEEVLEENLHRVRECARLGKLVVERVEAKNRVRLAVDVDSCLASERVCVARAHEGPVITPAEGEMRLRRRPAAWARQKRRPGECLCPAGEAAIH
jgi:hypothetical protein